MSGSRVAFEAQARPGDLSDESSEDDDDDVPSRGNELSMRLSSIVDLVKKLYQLGFKIRNPDLRQSSLKASLYREVDPDTGIDVFDVFSEFDRRHVDTLLQSLLQKRELPAGASPDPNYLMTRLAASITLRRKHFRYWEKHGKKLSLHSIQRIQPATTTKPSQSDSQGPGARLQEPSQPLDIHDRDREQKTLLMSVTEATKYQEVLDDSTERGTVMSYASSALEVDGHRLELPNPPIEALKGNDFVCPYCSVICPARYGQRKAWRQVLLCLRDLLINPNP